MKQQVNKQPKKSTIKDRMTSSEPKKLKIVKKEDIDNKRKNK